MGTGEHGTGAEPHRITPGELDFVLRSNSYKYNICHPPDLFPIDALDPGILPQGKTFFLLMRSILIPLK